MLNFEIILPIILSFVVFYSILRKPFKESIFFQYFIITGSILVGVYLRGYLSYFSLGNFDMESYKIVSDLILAGKNVYLHTYRYNYSPIWFLILGILKIINLKIAVPFAFVVRLFLTFVDLATLFVLIKIARIKKVPIDKVTVYFFLNPISIVLTGFHGQFENLVIFLILFGIFIYLKNKKRSIFSWVFITVAGITKHLVFNQILIFLKTVIRQKTKIAAFFILSVALFLVSFLPFLKEGQQGIVNSVFKYSSGSIGHYGFTSIIERFKLPFKLMTVYKALFYPLYFIYPLFLSSKDILKNSLLGMLFFLTFTFGYVVQSAILPIALGSLRGGIGFLIYTLVISFYVAGHGAELDILRFKTINLGEIWYVVLFWYFIEAYLRRNRK